MVASIEFNIDIREFFKTNEETMKSFCGVQFRVPTIKDINIINTVRDYIYDVFQGYMLTIHHKQQHLLTETDPQAIKQAFNLLKEADGYTKQEIRTIFANVVEVCHTEHYNARYVPLKNAILQYCKDEKNIINCYGNETQEESKYTKGQFKYIDTLELGTIDEHEAFEKELIVGFLEVSAFKPLIKRMQSTQKINTMASQQNG